MLARVAEDRGGAGARLLAGGHEHEIVPFTQTGWGFELRDGGGARSGGFQPFRLRRGGRLRVREVGVSLHGWPWAHEGWALSLPDGRRVEGDRHVAGRRAGMGEQAPEQGRPGSGGTAGGAAHNGSFVVLLEAVGALDLLALTEVLALGNWPIARWHVSPAADHVLASAATGTGPAKASVKSRSAGICAQAAN